MEKNARVIRHKRSENIEDEKTILDNNNRKAILIQPSWNPIRRNEKPPYSYATIIAHAILSSKERKLTLNEIYHWITLHYPFYSNESQGWQNSIRHNLSLHKSFVKVERDPNPPRKGCFWTIRKGKESKFIENLQKPIYNNKRTNYKHTDDDDDDDDDDENDKMDGDDSHHNDTEGRDLIIHSKQKQKTKRQQQQRQQQQHQQQQTHLILTNTNTIATTNTTVAAEQPSSVCYDAYRIYPEIDMESTSCDTFSTHSEDHHYSLFNSPPTTTTKQDWSLNYFT